VTITSGRFGKIEVPREVVTYLRRHCQKPRTPETGGALGGYFRKGGTLVVSHVMPPSPRNKAGFAWLKRHRGDAQIFVNAVFADSGGAANYIGEWHTHPEPHPTPSGRDFKMMEDLLKRSKLEIGFLVGLIVGDTGEICLWLQDAAGNREVFAAAMAAKS
jgi:integrative and conjugative element protein (TIGR02256 family)